MSTRPNPLASRQRASSAVAPLQEGRDGISKPGQVPASLPFFAIPQCYFSLPSFLRLVNRCVIILSESSHLRGEPWNCYPIRRRTPRTSAPGWRNNWSPARWWPLPGIWGRARPPSPGAGRGLGIPDRITSPTFTIVNEYEGGRLPLFHFDMYRLGSADELFDIGWEDYLRRGGVCAVEWSENIADAAGGGRRAGGYPPGCLRPGARHYHCGGEQAVKILALESSAVACSAALCEDENLIAQSFQDNGLTPLRHPAAHGRRPAGAVRRLPGAGGRRRRGRWPGLLHRSAYRRGRRQGAGLAGSKPCAAVPPWNPWLGRGPLGMDICAVMDARRNQVYNARFLGTGGRAGAAHPRPGHRPGRAGGGV